MKDPGAPFIAKEEAAERRPAELYHMWQVGIADWYYTSGDVAVVYDGHTYAPAAIQRGETRLTGDEMKMKVIFNALADPIADYIDQTMVDEVWIEVSKIHRDQSPLVAMNIFIGKIEFVVFNGNTADAHCVGLQEHFKRPIPGYRYQVMCNHALYDQNTCKVDKTLFDMSTQVSVSADGLVLTSDIFTTRNTDWLTFGFLTFGNYKRMIVAHDGWPAGDTISIRYAIPGLVTGSWVIVYAGCNKAANTCMFKFDNMAHFLGFPYIPWDNPALKLG